MQPSKTTPWHPDYLRNFKARKSYRFAALTWGTRGDVQPFVALGMELARRGHHVTVAARAPFRSFVEERGLDFHEMEEDGTDQLMHTLADAGAGGGAVNIGAIFTKWQRSLITAQFRQFQDVSEGADVLISNAFAAIPAVHIAEKRGIPLVQAFFDPGFVATRRYGIFENKVQDRGALLNVATTRLGNIMKGLLVQDIVAAWRRSQGMRWVRHVELFSPSLLRHIPSFAAWSPSLLERPRDWPGGMVQTGRWQWPAKENESVSPSLLEFMRKGPAPVYIGFGSWGAHDKTAATEAILSALGSTRSRGVVHRNTVDGRTSFPEHVYVDDNLPHEWLLPQVKAAVHHGGAGTTGAVAAAGVPSVIIPAFFGQVAWGDIVSRRGAGTMLDRRDLNAETLAAALAKIDTPEVRERARAIGARAREDGGVRQAAEVIERRLAEAEAMATS